MDASLSGSVSTTSRGELFLGLLPFLVLGAAAVLMEAPNPVITGQGPAAQYIGGVLFLTGYLLILAILLWAWLKEFPRWSMPYLVYGIIFAMYLFAAATPGLVIFGITMWGTDMWGFRACVPIGLVVLFGLLLSRPPWKPVTQLFKNIWNDWTFLAFGLFGLLPLILLILQDEMDHAYTFWPTIIAVLIMLAGAALYLIYAHKPFRAMFLLVGMFLAILAVSVGTNFYWKTHSIDIETNVRTPLAGPVPWGAITTESLSSAGIVTLFFAITGVVGLLHYWVGRGEKRNSL